MDIERENMLKELMALDFSIIDIHLYLNTHPSDQRAIMIYNNLVQRANMLMQRYEQMFGPLLSNTFISKTPWQWIDNPWPWDRQ